jgi:acetyl esterase/lipase
MQTLSHLKWASIRAIANTALYIRTSPYFSPTTQPNFTKTYPCRPHLYACRVFLPKATCQGKKPLPLVIRAHGGGFIVNAPSADDILARRLADLAHCVVVSIDYSKSPQSKFPVAHEDVIAQILEIIADAELAIDATKVVLCGSSAGGNLILCAAQDARLRSKIAGVVAIYPVVEFGVGSAEKMGTRPDAAAPDFIGKSWDTIRQLYVDDGQGVSMEDVRLSPTFFGTRGSLPGEVLLIGAEHDMFCRELEVMADKLADNKAKVSKEGGWKAPGVQYYKVYGQPHAFEGFAVKDAEAEKKRVAATDAMINTISEWLMDTFSEAVS